jgi:hypothetical protein
VWSFVVLVVTPTNATIYLRNTNGPASAQVDHTHAPSAFAGETRIGNDAYNFSRTFTGKICGVTIFNRALSPDEIAFLYQAAVGSFYQPILASTWDGAHLTLAWPGNATLLESTNINGPWSPNLDARPPYALSPTGAAKFLRLQLPQ